MAQNKRPMMGVLRGSFWLLQNGKRKATEAARVGSRGGSTGVPKVFQDSNSSCDSLSENWQFALAELNNSHYMAACIEDDARTSGSGNGQLPPGLKIWKTIPFVEDTLVSGTKAVKLIC
ncbi:hypothetical protein EJB05_11052, partial [Eragrostis curvula]